MIYSIKGCLWDSSVIIYCTVNNYNSVVKILKASPVILLLMEPLDDISDDKACISLNRIKYLFYLGYPLLGDKMADELQCW